MRSSRWRRKRRTARSRRPTSSIGIEGLIKEKKTFTREKPTEELLEQNLQEEEIALNKLKAIASEFDVAEESESEITM